MRIKHVRQGGRGKIKKTNIDVKYSGGDQNLKSTQKVNLPQFGNLCFACRRCTEASTTVYQQKDRRANQKKLVKGLLLVRVKEKLKTLKEVLNMCAKRSLLVFITLNE